MNRWIFLTGVAVLLSNIISLGCEEWLVGAPCVAETDTGDFAPLETPGATTYSLETRSVQCKGANMVCLTTLHRYIDGYPDLTGTNEYEQWLDTHVKYSFCSCRCKDAAGHKYDRNSDKYDDLCPCPTRTTCVEVLGSDIDAPEKVQGSYCMPNCVADPTLCTKYETCTPSSNSEEPWKWSCNCSIWTGTAKLNGSTVCVDYLKGDGWNAVDALANLKSLSEEHDDPVTVTQVTEAGSCKSVDPQDKLCVANEILEPSGPGCPANPAARPIYVYAAASFPDSVCTDSLGCGSVKEPPYHSDDPQYYCKDCVTNPSLCTEEETCTPSSNSEEPWKWLCKTNPSDTSVE